MGRIPDNLLNYSGEECKSLRFFARGEEVSNVLYLQTPQVVYGTVSYKQERRIILRDWDNAEVSIVTSNPDLQVGPGHHACFVCCKSNPDDGVALALVNHTLGYFYPIDSWRFFWDRSFRKKKLFSNGDKAFEQFNQHCIAACKNVEPTFTT